MRIHFRLFFLLVLLLAGCIPRQKHVAAPGAPTFSYPLPAVFQAHLDLKRCPPISFELVLRPDGIYFLQMEKKASDNAAVQAEIGVWRYSEEGKSLRLTSYDKAVRLFTFTGKGKNVLKLLKVSGGMMPPLVRYDFTLAKTTPRYEGLVRMQGMYSRQRGRGIFRECLSGVRFPFTSGGRTADIEQAYQDILHGRDESLLVTLDMHFATGSGRRDLLIPVRSLTIDPYHSCQGKERRIATIANNRWYLTELAGEVVAPESVNKPPFLKVQSGEQLIQGFAGCNNFTGSWLFADNDFVFSRIRSTRMACPLGMEVEDTFLQALDDTRRYAITGDTLSLHDRQGRTLARLRYSRQLTELDFRYPAPDQEAADEAFLSDDITVPESHSVETGGAVPASLALPAVEARDEKTQALAPPTEKDPPTRHGITVLKAKKKVAVGKKAQAAGKRAQAKKVVPAPKPSASPVVQKKQEDKADIPPTASGDQEKGIVEQEEEKASAESGDKPGPAPQVKQKEEIPPSQESSAPTGEKNEQEDRGEPGAAVRSEAKLPAEQPTGQSEMQSGTEERTAPALPPIPEEDEDKQRVEPEPIPKDDGEQVPADETSQQGGQGDKDKSAPASLSSPQVVSDEQKGATVTSLPEEGEPAVLSLPGEKKEPIAEKGQAELQGDIVEEVAPPAISLP